MMFVLLVVTLFWVAPLTIASLLSLAAKVSPGVRAMTRYHLFGEEMPRVRVGARVGGVRRK